MINIQHQDAQVDSIGLQTNKQYLDLKSLWCSLMFFVTLAPRRVPKGDAKSPATLARPGRLTCNSCKVRGRMSRMSQRWSEVVGKIVWKPSGNVAVALKFLHCPETHSPSFTTPREFGLESICLSPSFTIFWFFSACEAPKATMSQRGWLGHRVWWPHRLCHRANAVPGAEASVRVRHHAVQFRTMLDVN